MALEDEELSLAVCNLLQAIIESLSGEDKREHRGEEEALVLGRRHSSVWVPGRGGQGKSVATSAWADPVRGGGLDVFLYLFYIYSLIIQEIEA